MRIANAYICAGRYREAMQVIKQMTKKEKDPEFSAMSGGNVRNSDLVTE